MGSEDFKTKAAKELKKLLEKTSFLLKIIFKRTGRERIMGHPWTEKILTYYMETDF